MDPTFISKNEKLCYTEHNSGFSSATLDDLKDFYLKWYGPNNAYLTISGDVTSEEVIPLLKKYFGFYV